MRLVRFLILGLAVAASAAMYAQDDNAKEELKKHEISIGLGFVSDDRNYSFFNSYFERHRIEDLGECYGIFEYCFSPNMQYFYNINKHIAIGGTIGISHFTVRSFGFEVDKNGDRVSNGFYDFDNRVFYAMPLAKYTWAIIRRTTFYSKVGAGLYYRRMKVDSEVLGNERQSDMLTSYQVTIAGFKARGKRLGMYGELGYGCQGILTFGMTLDL